MPQNLYPKEIRLGDDNEANFHKESFIELFKTKDTSAIRGGRAAHGVPIDQTRLLEVT